MKTVDDVRELLNEGGTVLLWSDSGDPVTYYALATHPNETTQHAMEQEKQMAVADTPSAAICCLVEKGSSEPEAMKALLGVAGELVEWDDKQVGKWASGRPQPTGEDVSLFLKELAGKARTALVSADQEGVGGE